MNLKSLAGRIARWRDAWRTWHRAHDASLQLDSLLIQADPDAPLAARNEWLSEVGFWLRRKSRLDGANVPPVIEGGRASELVRLRFLLNVLDRNPQMRARVATTLQSLFRDLDAVSLLCDTGMPQSPGIWSELRERISNRFIPPTPNTAEWSAMLTLLFPADGDADWVEHIDDETWQRLLGLLDDAPRAPGIAWAIQFLVSQVRAAAFHQAIRSRMAVSDFGHLPFLSLARCTDELLGVGEPPATPDADFVQRLNLFRALLEECRLAAHRVFEHLDENGVSIDIVFQVERILARLRRIELLVDVWLRTDGSTSGRGLLATLIRSNQARLSVADLTRRTFGMLARKVVERSAETGEHYIARNRSDYRHMLKAAGGGGVLTALTTYVKFIVVSLHLPILFEGVLASFNYAISFMAIQFAGYTLATKQPAMTAPALAGKLDNIGQPDGMREFVLETVCLIRSQVAAIVGNLALVFPVALGIQLFSRHLLGHDLISPDKALHTIESFSILGLTPLFAIFTGVLLWLSSLFAGWADNWFVYRRIGDVIAYHRRLRSVVGKHRALAMADFWRRHISGVAGNASLGFMLGLAPAVGAAFALTLEVRHVTLSTGAVAASIGVLGPAVLATGTFWLAVAGIALMGLLNLGVSFFLAFQMALRSHSLSIAQRSDIYRALRAEIRRDPLSLVWVRRADDVDPPNGSGH